MKNSSYHNTIKKLIKEGFLDKYEVVFEKHKNEYDNTIKKYKGKKVMIKVLRLYFNNMSLFIREPYIQEYIKFIEAQGE